MHPYEELLAFADTHTEEETRAWVLANMDRFPGDVKEQIVFSLFNEALDKQIEADTSITELEKEGVSAMEQLDRTEKTLADIEEVEKIREDLAA